MSKDLVKIYTYISLYNNWSYNIAEDWEYQLYNYCGYKNINVETLGKFEKLVRDIFSKLCRSYEKWGYELAYLYHKAGMVEKCVDACDELILWFGDGPYVERALELKMLYQPLTKIQEEKLGELFGV